MKGLTEQQRLVRFYAVQGRSAPEIARLVPMNASLVYDQARLIRKKGFDCPLRKATRPK